MNILKINGTPIMNPSSLQWQESDLDSGEGSGRNQLGDTFRDRITVKKKISVSFPPMNDSDMSSLLQSISSVFFELEYPDPKLGKSHLITVYVGDRSIPVYMYDKIMNQWVWQSMSIEFIEK